MTRWRTAAVAVAAVGVLGAGTACGGSSSDERSGPPTGAQRGDVDTSQFEGLLTECHILPDQTIADTVGGTSAFGTFSGAICRWVVTGGVTTDVTLNWFEWGNITLEKQAAQEMGFQTENIQVHSMAAFTARDPSRPQVCGVTARSPGRGILTWWVEPQSGGGGDPCAAPTALMELVIDRAH
ncbi:hypothetical protein GOHSU_08_00600 [Gordonia hirsuta DSM 44140 = NBRC 16056]|uniref:DUF3558 domain-containing protein n=2 Tax=Gordonia hirsuta TaxID=53427 RepID=L7L923_9ACTN|nr:DUF3558 domain-containing protein [Gordonia hirsuta]GAC56532.1 hypothetical protein GOHSU_08_00600 [Gordonia hirsuta DSM 44140 = NBRC 16056]